MNHFLRQKALPKWFLQTLAFFACSAIAAYSSQYTSASFDTYWHLQSGIDLLVSGTSPWRDHYSYTHLGGEIKNQPILFQIIIATAKTQLSIDQALMAVRLFCAILFFGALSLYLSQLKTSLPIFIFCLLGGLFFFEIRPLVRPELIDLTLIVLGFAQYHQLLHSFSARNLVLTAALTGSWAVFHAGILPYVIFFGLFIDVLIKHRLYAETRVLLNWFLWGLIFLLIGFLDPSGQHPVLATLTFSDFWDVIGEHRPSSETIENIPFAYALWTTMALVFLWSLLVKRLGIALVIAIFLWASIDRVRMISISGVVLICSLALLSVESASKRTLRQLSLPIQRTVLWSIPVYALVITMQLASTIEKMKRHDFEFPTKVMDYWDAEKLTGNVLNLYRYGGYVLFRGEGSAKVFIDGRTNILYPPEFFSLYLAATEGDPTAISLIANRYKPDYAIWNFDKRFYLSAKQLGLNASFIGEHGVLFSYAGKLSSLLERLLFPMCQFDSNEAIYETSKATLINQNSPNEELLRLVTALSDASPNEWVALAPHIYRQNGEAKARSLRLLAHTALYRDELDVALKLWRLLFNEFDLAPLDLLYAADTALKTKEFAWSRTFLTTLFFSHLQGVKPMTIPQLKLGTELHALLESADQSNSALRALIDSANEQMAPVDASSVETYNQKIESVAFMDANQCYRLLHPRG